ncbi:MAG TPA: sugar phosphate isomerase/epimerase family protein [Herpetosiphonaceae bacterium]
MEIGIFAKTFIRPTLAETLDAVVAHGIGCVQFNMACAGVPSLPEQIDAALSAEIRGAMEARQLRMAAVSGTFNMIHPDLRRRQDGLARLRTLAAACHDLGTSVITLSTGTRDPDDMWRRHPANDTPESWRDLLAALSEALTIAEEHRVTLAFEPEVSNVVDSAFKGRRLLDELRSPYLKVVMDGANLFHAGELPRMREILDQAFALLGDDIVIAHAKDLSHDGDAGHEAAGTGLLDYDHYLALLRGVGFRGPLILHALAEDQVAQSVAFLVAKGVSLGAEGGSHAAV